VRKNNYKQKTKRDDSRTQRERESFEVTIERIVPGGYGLAHADGKTIFVSLAVTGDVAIARVERKKGAVVFASIVELIKPSPFRVKPPCRYFGRCGGCDFQQMSYEAQLTAKKEIILDCLRRIGKLDVLSVPSAVADGFQTTHTSIDLMIHPSPNEWNARARAQWHYDSEKNLLGYFERGSHNICDVVECPVLTPRLQDSLKSLRALKQSNELPFDVKEFQAVAGNNETSLMPEPDFSPTREIEISIGDFNYKFSAEVFFQTNPLLLPALIDYAIGDARGETALDLYSGVGLFALPLAKRFKRAVGVEYSPESVAFARENAKKAKLENISFACSGVSNWLKEYAEEIGTVDFILLDPPRTGAEDETISSLINLKPKQITYVSCDPATLARDLRMLTDADFIIEKIEGFDLFPQTHHVETIARLRLK